MNKCIATSQSLTPCDGMKAALGAGYVKALGSGVFSLPRRRGKDALSRILSFCPWCGAKIIVGSVVR